MRRRALFALAVSAALPTETWAQPKPLALPSTWYGVQIDGNAFTVELPGIPDYRQLNDASARGTAFVLHSYSLEAGGYSYVVQTATYPADVDVGDPRRLIQAALDDRAKVLEGGKWSKVVLLKGRRLVSLAFMGPAASMAGTEAERFFKSLKMK